MAGGTGGATDGGGTGPDAGPTPALCLDWACVVNGLPPQSPTVGNFRVSTRTLSASLNAGLFSSSLLLHDGGLLPTQHASQQSFHLAVQPDGGIPDPGTSLTSGTASFFSSTIGCGGELLWMPWSSCTVGRFLLDGGSYSYGGVDCGGSLRQTFASVVSGCDSAGSIVVSVGFSAAGLNTEVLRRTYGSVVGPQLPPTMVSGGYGGAARRPDDSVALVPYDAADVLLVRADGGVAIVVVGDRASKAVAGSALSRCGDVVFATRSPTDSFVTWLHADGGQHRLSVTTDLLFPVNGGDGFIYFSPETGVLNAVPECWSPAAALVTAGVTGTWTPGGASIRYGQMTLLPTGQLVAVPRGDNQIVVFTPETPRSIPLRVVRSPFLNHL